MNNWFVIDLHYIQPLEAIDAAMGDHVAFLHKHQKAGVFIAWGRKQPRTGGIILACAASMDEVNAIVGEDPFVQRSLARVNITEFSPKPQGIVRGVLDLLA